MDAPDLVVGVTHFRLYGALMIRSHPSAICDRLPPLIKKIRTFLEIRVPVGPFACLGG